jgi:hypothetical protein
VNRREIYLNRKERHGHQNYSVEDEAFYRGLMLPLSRAVPLRVRDVISIQELNHAQKHRAQGITIKFLTFLI